MVKSLDSAIMILTIARSADPSLSSSAAVNTFFELLHEVALSSVRIARQGLGDVKVLCIEGLSGSGKSTLVQGLVSRAGAIVIEALDASVLLELRQLFSQSPEPVTTALDFALNYITAYRITTSIATATATTTTIYTNTLNTNRPLIIVDSFYHSVCARTVCANVGSDVDLKSLSASAFEWPLDLPTPTLVSQNYNRNNHIKLQL